MNHLLDAQPPRAEGSVTSSSAIHDSGKGESGSTRGRFVRFTFVGKSDPRIFTDFQHM